MPASYRKTKEMFGKKFGRLTVIGTSSISGKVECRCECGKTSHVYPHELRSGSTVSCGCYLADLMKKMFTTHGMSKTSTYRSWKKMKERCLNPNCKDYPNYGGRGISICKKWMKFSGFFADMGEKPDGLSIERIDSDKGYCKSNCKWAGATEQSRNRSGVKLSMEIAREVRRLRASGMTYKQVIEATGVSYSSFRAIIRNQQWRE